jgi:RHH-type rel operon transcriptional repressor/antitoxin RelB
MATISVQLPEDLTLRLEQIVERTGKSKSDYMIEAIREYMDDLESIAIAEQRLADHLAGRTQSYSQEEMEARYGLAS